MMPADEKDLKLFIGHKDLLILNKVANFLNEQGIKSYIVGGFIRDALLGRDTADIDIAVDADALEIAPRLATTFGGRYVLLDKINKVGRVVVANGDAYSSGKRWEIDLSMLRSGIEQDLARRDFTIDAMAIDLGVIVHEPYSSLHDRDRGVISLEHPMIIDPFGGCDDLNQGIIRAVSDTVFESDAARLLRAVRLAAELGFTIDKGTEDLIRSSSYLVANVAGERMREELLRLLAVPQAGQSLCKLDRLGLLTALIPELAQLKGVEQPKEHFWDVFDHSLKTVVAVDFLLRQEGWEYASDDVLAAVPWSVALVQHFKSEVSSGSTRELLLKVAALLHDVAKPQTKAIDADGRMRFLGHDKEGAAIAANILERLRFSTKEAKLVEIMVRHHLRPEQMSHNELPSHKAIYRYFRDTGEAGVDTLFLCLADHLATRGPHLNLTQWQEHTKRVEYVLAQRFQKESLVVPPKLVDGNDLINVFGMSPGPEIGKILEMVREAQASGEITTREEALAYMREHLVTKVA